MRKPEQTTEPSIEEILASIRRIIADDGATAPAPVFESSGPETGREQAEAHYAGVQQDDFWQDDDFGDQEHRTPAPGEDEILELTEDFMVGEAAAVAARQAMEQADEQRDGAQNVAAALHAEHAAGYAGYREYSEGEDAPPSRPEADDLEAPGMFAAEAPLTSEGLDSVLSNVVAEMHRLSEGHGLDAAKGFDPYEEEEEPEPEPDAEELEAELQPAWQPPVRPAQAGPVQRPVWSARHRDGDGVPARDAKSSEPVSREPLPHQAGETLEDLAAGMPDIGPGAPFFAPPAEAPAAATAKSAATQQQPAASARTAPAAAEGSRTVLEEERRAVGETLSRAFADVAEPEESEAEASGDADARGLQAKAAELAREAVSDFAAEKLSAPPVAHALRADKPFMDEITTSLAGALARKAAQKGEAEAPEVELPEGALPPDLEADAAPAAFAPEAVGEEVAARDAVAAAPELRREEPEETPASKVSADDAVPAGLPDGLEGAVVEMLKPLIINWLNDNLPRLVEKALREEIAASGSLTRRAAKANGAQG